MQTLGGAGRQFRGLRFALSVTAAVAITVILTAIDVQSGRILDREGHGWSFRVLFGPDVDGSPSTEAKSGQGQL